MNQKQTDFTHNPNNGYFQPASYFVTKALSVVIITTYLFSSLKDKLSPAFRFPLNEVAEKETVL